MPALDWHHDLETWEGLGGWLFVNLAFGNPPKLIDRIPTERQQGPRGSYMESYVVGKAHV